MIAKQKTTFVIMALSILLALSITSTIVLAAFSSQKTASTTIRFANGLKMELTPKGTGTFQITSAGQDATNFVYNTNNQITGQTGSVTLDGITATLNKPGYVAYQMVLQEGGSGVSGSWVNNSGLVTFVPTGAPTASNTDWKAVLSVNTSNFSVAAAANVVTVTGTSIWAAGALTKDLFASLVFSGYNDTELIDSLAGRTFSLGITIKASTESALTFD